MLILRLIKYFYQPVAVSLSRVAFSQVNVFINEHFKYGPAGVVVHEMLGFNQGAAGSSRCELAS